MSKIKAGLYEYRYKIDDDNTVVYTVEKNGGELNVGSWILRYRIGLDEDTSDEWYSTKAEAVAAANKMAGNWSRHRGLGWCYDG